LTMSDVSSSTLQYNPPHPQAAAIKAEANKAFAAKDYTTAVKLYSDGIAIDGSNHVLYSNRSAAKSGMRDYQGALEDAEKVRTVLDSAYFCL
jgi:hypothetical protein